ncbi:MAG: hypothetical protein QM490_04460 [Candidatus Gracilibacteria bacterium]
MKKLLGLLLKYKPLGLIKLSNNNLTKELIEGLKKLPCGFVVYSEGADTEKKYNNLVITGELDNSLIAGFDFMVCDDEITNLNNYIEGGVTPIIIRNNHMSAILKEFNPIKNNGNSFFYDELNEWSIFYSIARYMENYKFPHDNKNLVKNVINI